MSSKFVLYYHKIWIKIVIILNMGSIFKTNLFNLRAYWMINISIKNIIKWNINFIIYYIEMIWELIVLKVSIYQLDFVSACTHDNSIWENCYTLGSFVSSYPLRKLYDRTWDWFWLFPKINKSSL